MKANLKTTLTLIVLIAILFACKKKKDEEPTPTVPTTPAHVNTMTAKVNGNNWSWTTNSNFSSFSIGKMMGTYNWAGYSNFSSPNTAIRLIFTYTTGLITLAQYGAYQASYTDSAGISYVAKTGTLNIITLDTLAPDQGMIGKFKANFSFITDTIANKCYTITNGNLDYIRSQ